MQLHIGTSGYSYSAWKGKFYPASLPAKQMLGYYATHFSAVEINSSFYRMPKAETLSAWTTQVPSEFRFAFKAPRRITHDRRLRNVAKEAKEFLQTTETLDMRCGPLLFQLPPTFALDRERLSDFLASLPRDGLVAFEFRHPSWHTPEIYDLLRAHGVALCIADTDNGTTPLETTADWGYVRLRRAAYNDNELRDWWDRLQRQHWREVFVFFKHEDEARGPAFAQRLSAIAQNA